MSSSDVSWLGAPARKPAGPPCVPSDYVGLSPYPAWFLLPWGGGGGGFLAKHFLLSSFWMLPVSPGFFGRFPLFGYTERLTCVFELVPKFGMVRRYLARNHPRHEDEV